MDYIKILLSYLTKYNIQQVDSLDHLHENTHLISEKKNSTSCWLNHDPYLFIKDVFNADDFILDEIRSLHTVLGSFLQPKNIHTNLNNSTLAISVGLNIREEYHFCIIMTKSNLMIHFVKDKGIVFKDLSSVIDVKHVPIINNDINRALRQAINDFKKALVISSGLTIDDTLIDDSFIAQLRSTDDASVINARIKMATGFDGFLYRSKDVILEEFYEQQEKYPKASFHTRSNGFTFSKNGTVFLLQAIKTLFSTPIYNNLHKAINFYHNYNVLMNIESCTVMEFQIKRKLDGINGVIFKLSFDDEFYVDFAIKDNHYDKECQRTTFFEVYSINNNAAIKYDRLRTDDLEGLYEHLFSKYSVNLTKILNKPVEDMSLADASVLMMVNF
jgi:hypothetical protein